MSVQLHDTYFVDISFEDYRRVLSMVATPDGLQTVQAWGIPTPLLRFAQSIKETLTELAKLANTGIKELTAAMASKGVFSILKAIKFNVVILLRGLEALTRLIPTGLDAFFKELARSDLVNQLRKGAVKVDEVLSRYPILKKLAGPALGALLFWIWLNMSFTGDFHNDFDLSVVGQAFAGRFSVADLFVSPAGLTMLSLLATGMLGFSVPWLGNSLYNLTVALVYTGAKQLRQSDLAAKLKPVLGLKRI